MEHESLLNSRLFQKVSLDTNAVSASKFGATTIQMVKNYNIFIRII